MSNKLFEGKVAVVTGAGTGGMGAMVCLGLGSEGAKVVVNDMRLNLAEEVVAKIKDAGGEAIADSNNVIEGYKIIETALEKFGRIDIVVNCAGIHIPARANEMTDDQFDAVVAVHLKGTWTTCRRAIPEMIKQGGGRIVNVASRGAFFGGIDPAYSAAKAGIMGLTGAISNDMKEYNIEINAIVPSAITKLFTKRRDSKYGPGDDGMPIYPDGDPKYIAPCIMWLASDLAKGVTGKYIYTSGGDICVYAHPLKVKGNAPVIVRKLGMWTVEELAEMVNPLCM